MSVEDLAAKITPATKLVWLEAPGSVTMEFPDLVEQVRLCRARGVTMVLDNTWGAGLAFVPSTCWAMAAGRRCHGPCPDQVPQRRRRCADGQHHHAQPGPAYAHQARAHAPGPGRERQRRRSRCAACPASACAITRRIARTPAGVAGHHSAVAQVLHPAMPDAPGHAYWKQLCAQGQGRMAWPPVCSAWSSTSALTRRPWTLLRQPAPVQARLQLGRARESGRAL
jgi:cystathionine beta-lyase